MTQTLESTVFRRATYLPLVGQPFDVEGSDGAVALELIAVVEHRSAGESFSLRFTAPDGVFVPQGIHPLAHPAIGSFELFLVPIGPGSTGAHEVEAVINQLPEAGSTNG